MSTSTITTAPRSAGRPARTGDFRMVAGLVPNQLAALVLAPVGRGRSYRWKTQRVIALLEAGVAAEAAGVEPPPLLYTGSLKWVGAEIPVPLAAQVIDPDAPITSRLIFLLHLGLQEDPYTVELRRLLTESAQETLAFELEKTG